MTEPTRLSQMIEDARRHGVPAFDRATAYRFAERTEARRRRRRTVRALAGAGVALAALALAWVRWSASPDSEPARVAAPTEAPRLALSNVLRFADGSVATPLDDDTELFVDRMDTESIEIVLVRGAARFEVTPGLSRGFRVRAGTVTVSVVGTVFTVRREGPGAGVEVDEGRVRVEWSPDGHAEISAGGRGVYPTREEEPAPLARRAAPPPATEHPSVRPPPAPPRAARPAREESSVEPEPAPSIPRWRELAEAARYDEGYRLLLADVGVLRSSDVEALMLAADCARLSGHPAESLAYLDRALEVGRHDYRAPIIAFTLGRVLLQQLDRPAQAADAFARARQLAPQGSLAQDALAREVEACHRAGLAARARTLALDYLRLYPDDDLRATAVRRHGGLD